MSSSDAHAHATTRTWPTTSRRSRSRTTPSASACGCSSGPRCCSSPGSSSATRSTGTSITRPSTRPRAHAQPGARHDQHDRAHHQQLDGRARVPRDQARPAARSAWACWCSRSSAPAPSSSSRPSSTQHKFDEGALPGQCYHFARGHGARREPLLHDLLPHHRPARLPRHRRDVGADLGAGRPQGEVRPATTTCRSSWGASTGTSSTWSGSSCSRCST